MEGTKVPMNKGENPDDAYFPTDAANRAGIGDKFPAGASNEGDTGGKDSGVPQPAKREGK